MKRVRAKCGATGVDIGGGLCLIVSAQDNDIFVDEIDLDPVMEPHTLHFLSQLRTKRLLLATSVGLPMNRRDELTDLLILILEAKPSKREGK